MLALDFQRAIEQLDQRPHQPHPKTGHFRGFRQGADAVVGHLQEDVVVFSLEGDHHPPQSVIGESVFERVSQQFIGKRGFTTPDYDLMSAGFQFQGRRSAILLAGWPLTMRSSTSLM